MYFHLLSRSDLTIDVHYFFFSPMSIDVVTFVICENVLVRFAS